MTDDRAIGEQLVKALRRPAIGGPTALVVPAGDRVLRVVAHLPLRSRAPGAVLFGAEQEFPVDDWTFANQVTLCQIQVNAVVRPHAINLNCFANADGDLLPQLLELRRQSAGPASRSGTAGRGCGLDRNVYPVHLTRIVDPAELDRAWVARARQAPFPGGSPPTRPRPSAPRGPTAGGRSASGRAVDAVE